MSNPEGTGQRGSQSWWPCWFLLGCMLASGGVLKAIGQLNPEIVNDSDGYLHYPLDSLNAALRHQRSPAYPLFLKLLSLLPGFPVQVPLAQFVVYCAAVWTVYRGLESLTGRQWGAALVAASLMTTNVLYGYVQTVATDLLAVAFGMMACRQICLYLSRSDHNRRILLMISAAASLCWMLRPAYLFMVPLVPLLGGLIAWQHCPLSGPRKSVWGTAGILLAVVTVPLLGWCSFRYSMIGEFNTVSFGGYNLVGVTGQFLDEGLVRELDPSLQPLAKAALKKGPRASS